MQAKNDYTAKKNVDKIDIKPIEITNNSRPYYQSLARLGSAFSTLPRKEVCLSPETQTKNTSTVDESLSSPIDDQMSTKFDGLRLISSPPTFNQTEPDLSYSPSDSIMLNSVGLRSNSASRLPSRPSHNSPLISRDEKLLRLRRIKTFAAESAPNKPSIGSRTYSQPITSASYSTLPKSAAVSFLSMFADSTASNLTATNPDEEGQEVGDYVMGKIIATGAFSTVREAYTFDERSKDPIKLAVKVIRKDNNIEEDKIDELEHEIVLWKKLNHPSILKFIDVIDTDYAMFIFMELCPNGTLLNYVLANEKLSEMDARAIFFPIASSIRYLHQDLHIIHRDLKLENIVLTDDFKPKLTDFGLSQYDNSTTSNDSDTSKPAGRAGSITYCPPELFSTEGSNDYSSDIWSLGVILYALVAGEFPFSDGFEPRLVMKIRNGSYAMPETFSSELQNLICSMLSVKPSDRPTIAQVLTNPWCRSS